MIKSLRFNVGICLLACTSFSASLSAVDEIVTGDLVVEERVDVLSGPISLSTASFFDELNAETTAEGLIIKYSEVPQIWSGGDYVPGRSTVIQRVAHELADFRWQVSIPDGLGGFNSGDLMKLSSETLGILPSIAGNGAANILPNQTLDGGAASILTKELADNLYLPKSGGTISGATTVNGVLLIANPAGGISMGEFGPPTP